MADSLTSRKYFDSVYIPVGLIVIGTFIVKREWAPYSIALALALGGWKFQSLRKHPLFPLCTLHCFETLSPRPLWPLSKADAVLTSLRAEVKKVLKPDVFQEFELKEKTVVSHNSAM